MTELKEIRLFFEPKSGTNVNHNEMFKHYASSWLDGFDAEWGGAISMNRLEKVDNVNCETQLKLGYLVRAGQVRPTRKDSVGAESYVVDTCPIPVVG